MLKIFDSILDTSKITPEMTLKMTPKMTSKMTPKMRQLVSPVSQHGLLKCWPEISRARSPLIVNE